MDEELLKIGRRVCDNGEVYPVGSSLVITRRGQGFVSGVFDNGTRLPRFYGKSEVSYLLGISEGFSINIVGTPQTVGFSLVFENPHSTGVSAEDFVYPEPDEEKDAEWRANQPSFEDFFYGSVGSYDNRNFQKSVKMNQVSELTHKVFDGPVDDLNLRQEIEDCEASVSWVLSLRANKEFTFRGEKLEGFRALVDTADYVQISLERREISQSFSLTFGVYDVRF